MKKSLNRSISAFSGKKPYMPEILNFSKNFLPKNTEKYV